MILGITGGTGCGKTTLLSEVETRGGLVLDCDAIYHRLLTTDPGLLSAIRTAFPDTVQNGQLDRKKLGSQVFSDPQSLEILNSITHKAVKGEVLRQLDASPRFAAIDAIALFEGGLACLCQFTVAVTAPTEDRVRRLMARDGISEDYARSRIAAQHQEAWFRSRCDRCLRNDGTREEFRDKCIAFLDTLDIMEEELKRRP